MSGDVKKTDDALPKEMGLSAGAGGSYFIESIATNGGYSLHVDAAISREWWDKSIGLSAFYQRDWMEGKLFPGGGSGTTVDYDSNLFGLKFWKKERGIYGGDDKKDHTLGTISGTSIGFGWSSFGSSRSLGGETFTVSKPEKVPIMYMGNLFGVSWQAFVSERLYFEPELLFESGTYIPLTGEYEFGQQPMSPDELKITFLLRFGDGGADNERAKENAPTTYDHVYSFTGDALSYFGRGMKYRLNKNMAGGSSLVEGLTGEDAGSDPHTESLPAFYLIKSGMAGAGMAGFVEECHAAHESGSVVCGIRLGLRAAAGLTSVIGGFAAGKDAGGESLIADGVADAGMVLGSGLSMSGIDPAMQLLVEGIVAGGLQIGGAFADNKGVNMGGGRYMFRLTMFPDPRRSKLVKGKEVTARYSKTLKGGGDHGMSVAGRNYLDIAGGSFPDADEGIFVSTEAQMDFAGVVENVASKGGSNEVNLTAPVALRTGVGIQKNVPIKKGSAHLSFSIEGYTAQQFSGSQTAGVGAAGGIGLTVDVTDKFSVGIGGRAGAEKMVGQEGRVYLDGGLTFKWR